MPATATSIHPTATIHPTADLGAAVEIGPGAIVGPNCRIGDRTSIGPSAVIVRDTTLGADNRVHAHAVLGDDPQDRAYKPDADPGSLTIGNNNIIREFATIHRGAGDAGPTIIGSNGFFMVSCHVGHNCRVGDRVILANFAALSGHVRLGDGCVLSGHAAVHQFCDVGELCMFQGGAGTGQHVPPFSIVHRAGNRIAGINVVGMRRAGYSSAEITSARTLYRLLFRTTRPLRVVLEEARERSWSNAALRVIEFCDAAIAAAPPRARGVCRAADRDEE